MRARVVFCAAVVVALTAGVLPRSVGGARPAEASVPVCHGIAPFPAFSPAAVDDGVPTLDGPGGAKKYKYIKTGENHFSFAFTYACMATNSVSSPVVIG
jgi:hypothetical protein